MQHQEIQPVILSGGAGTRLWPMSREHYPKQLLNLVGDGTLLQQTAARLNGMNTVASPLFVCNEEHRFLIGEQMEQIGMPAATIMLEPVGRNTAPAATLAALWLKSAGIDPVMLVMPADHVISDKTAFQATVAAALSIAKEGWLVTFGVTPTAPSSGYGYIRRGVGNSVMEFVEKPDREMAERYLQSGGYLWNSGIFLMRVSVWLDELRRFAPDILQQCGAALTKGRPENGFYHVDRDAFTKCRNQSIDYAVMEKTSRAAVVSLDVGWSDVGAWSNLWEVAGQDENGNVVRGDVCLYDTQDSLVVAQHRLVAAIGLKNVIVIETPDALLVMDRSRAQDVKQVVEKLRTQKRDEHVAHRRVYRPWGYYEGVDGGERFQVKRLMVKPGAALSLQMHHHRAEHWVVVKGTARVIRDNETFVITENQSTYIPVGVRHRLENPGMIPLEIVEVQSGSYLGEDDIIRFADNYNRLP